MRCQVIVSWGDHTQYPFDLEEVQPLPHDQARAWLDQQFTELGCEPLRPTGKVLLADKVVAVAVAAGQSRFSQEAFRPWAQAFARASSSALAKPVVRVDVPSLSISY